MIRRLSAWSISCSGVRRLSAWSISCSRVRCSSAWSISSSRVRMQTGFGTSSDVNLFRLRCKHVHSAYWIEGERNRITRRLEIESREISVCLRKLILFGKKFTEIHPMIHFVSVTFAPKRLVDDSYAGSTYGPVGPRPRAPRLGGGAVPGRCF